MTDYTPVDCGLHSEYQLAVMHQERLRLTWRDINGQLRTEAVPPKDLLSRHHEEFLLVSREGGKGEKIRLDHILHLEHA